MFIKHFTYLIGIFLLCSGTDGFAQQENPTDSLALIEQHEADSIARQQRMDSLTLQKDPADRLTPTKEVFEHEITYKADSIVGVGTGLFLLYGNAEVQYGDEMQLKADFIRMNMDSNLVYAKGRKDSTGQAIGMPEFVEGSSSYVSEEMVYNFNSGKGFITNVVTEQGEGYVTSNETKKIDGEAFCMRGGKYTTCDHHDHPHFYLSMSKAKVRPGKNIVTGPAHLVIEDVPLPLFIPFGFFPFTDEFSSGFIIPEIGEEQSRGFFLRDGGYYFAVNDYFDFKALGSIYSLGSWDLSGRSNYKKRYKYSGSFSAKFMTNLTGEKGQPDYFKSKDFRINWSHRQDPKANMYQTFSASVNFSTSSYDRNNLNTVYDPDTRSRNHKQSSVTYARRFADSPFSLSGSGMASQNSTDSTLSLTLPQVNFTMSRITPFKRKKKIGKTRWYEKIGMSYAGVMSNSISGKESDVFNSDLVKDWRNGIRHSIPISTSFNILKNITVTPSASYTERWYSSHLEKELNPLDSAVVTDTIFGFNRVYDYSGALSASTKLYGFYKPWRKLFGDKVEAIRHVMTPSVSMSYRPDFGQEKFGYYGTYQDYEYNYADSSYELVERDYSKYEGALYGNASRGKSGVVSMSIMNNLEMKVRSDKDTANQFKKISLLESLSLNTSYNMAVDSLNWSNLSIRGRAKIFKGFGINFGATFDPYKREVDAYGREIRVNKTWLAEDGRIGQLTNANTSFGYSIDNKKLNNWFTKDDSEQDETGDELDSEDQGNDSSSDNSSNDNAGKKDQYGYVPFAMPWSLSFNFSYRISSSFNKETEDYDYKGTSNFRMNGSISLTDKWRLTGSSGYDFQRHEFTSSSFNLTRDLHCWSMNVSFVPFGPYKTYKFTIKVNSSILQDLKYEQQKSPWDRDIWN